jgi:hypothetical protein
MPHSRPICPPDDSTYGGDAITAGSDEVSKNRIKLCVAGDVVVLGQTPTVA